MREFSIIRLVQALSFTVLAVGVVGLPAREQRGGDVVLSSSVSVGVTSSSSVTGAAVPTASASSSAVTGSASSTLSASVAVASGVKTEVLSNGDIKES